MRSIWRRLLLCETATSKSLQCCKHWLLLLLQSPSIRHVHCSKLNYLPLAWERSYNAFYLEKERMLFYGDIFCPETQVRFLLSDLYFMFKQIYILTFKAMHKSMKYLASFAFKWQDTFMFDIFWAWDSISYCLYKFSIYMNTHFNFQIVTPQLNMNSTFSDEYIHW